MSLLQIGRKVHSFARPQARSIAQNISSMPRGQASAFLWPSKITSSRITCKSNAQPLRSFSTTIAPRPHLRTSRVSHAPIRPQRQQRFYNGQMQTTLKAGTTVVGGIIVSCALLFGWTSLQENEYKQKRTKSSRDFLNFYEKNAILSAKNIREGRYHTIISSAFSHGSLTHLALNMLALWSFGPGIVAMYGIPAFSIIYLGSAAAGSLAQLMWWNANPSKTGIHTAAGASAAIFGIVGVTACALPSTGVGLMFIPVAIPIRTAIAGMVGLSVASLNMGWWSDIGHTAHLGGLAFGALWWFVALRRGGRPPWMGR